VVCNLILCPLTILFSLRFSNDDSGAADKYKVRYLVRF
jgi:hypothetical protein